MAINSIPIVWWLTSFLTASVLVTVSALLLRDRKPGPRLMLAGSSIYLLVVLGNGVFIHVLPGALGITTGTLAWYTVTSTLLLFSHLIFAIGLLLHALSLRGRADRIAELEAILRSRDGIQ